MCGLAGFFDSSQQHSMEDGVGLLQRMGQAICHRGPDDHGEFFEPRFGVGISFRRLAILDLSPNGHQPMTSYSGRYMAAFNGEVYNFLRLKQQLMEEGKLPPLRGSSDTEIILAAVEAWGIEKTAQSCIGMFAMAIWDSELHELSLVRDRVGVKPLYVGSFGTATVFGSELKALRQHPSFSARVDRKALATYLKLSYVPEPFCLYEGVRKLQAGHILTLRPGEPVGESKPYWSLEQASETANRHSFEGSFDEASEALEALLRDCVGLRMIADVPLGAFLSGGVDSSLVVALMQAQSSVPVKSFSVGFSQDEYDEAKFAQAVAKHLGTEHSEHYISERDALETVPLLPKMFDEPFGDPSEIPTFLVCQMARRYVTVSLSGDGGDELFGGYNRYSVAMKLRRAQEKLPFPLRRAIAGGLGLLSPQSWAKIYSGVSWAFPKNLRIRRIDERIDVLQAGLEARDPMSLYESLMSHWNGPSLMANREAAYEIPEFDPKALASSTNFLAQMMLTDMATYMQEDVLAKVDRTSMAVSLEAREPLLDHRLIEFALSLPTEFRSPDPQTKPLLRSVLYRYVPKEMIERPKQGFAAPVGEWVNGPLRDWTDGLLDRQKLEKQGFLQPELVGRILLEHRSGRRNWQFVLWNILMFQAWLEDNEI